jgi:ligand-binding SRPBCC domain-containing protein
MQTISTRRDAHATWVLEREQIVPRPVEEVFAFFSEAQNLEELTPPFLRFQILTPLPIAMGEGTLIDYRIRLFGVPMKWRTRIDVWEPNVRFVDRQLRGPYADWRHLHAFEPVAGGTRMLDRVDYAIGLGPLGSLARALFVRRQLETIFDYRREAVERRFGRA